MGASVKEILELVENWHPRSCKTEKDYEQSLVRHLDKSLPNSEIVKQYAAGRVKGDIVVDEKILIEIKDSLDSTGKVQRLLGQIEIYATKWKGKVIVVICGDSQRDLLKMVAEKIRSLIPVPSLLDLFPEQKIFLRVK